MGATRLSWIVMIRMWRSMRSVGISGRGCRWPCMPKCDYVYRIKIYHFSNEGVTSWYDFAKSIIKLSGSKCNLIPVNSYFKPSKALRPKNVVLNTELIQTTLNLKISNWKDSLNECLKII